MKLTGLCIMLELKPVRWSVVARRRQSSTVRLNHVKRNAELELLCSRSCGRSLDAARRYFVMYIEQDVASV